MKSIEENNSLIFKPFLVFTLVFNIIEARDFFLFNLLV